MDFTRKLRFVTIGSRTDDPTRSKYTGVLSQESVRTTLAYAALHNLGDMVTDIWMYI